MTEKSFDNLSREELLTLVQQQRMQIDALRRQLDARQLVMDQAGSIAEAAMELSGVFHASQAAADQYLQSVEALKTRQESEYALRLSQAEEQCRAIVAQAEKRAAYYWDALQKRIDEMMDQHTDLVQTLCGGNAPESTEVCFGPDD